MKVWSGGGRDILVNFISLIVNIDSVCTRLYKIVVEFENIFNSARYIYSVDI